MFTVTEKAMRPASPERRCLYCKQAIGENHKDSCVLVMKRVKVRMTVEYEIEVPASWDKHMIEFHRNEGSWCSSNAISELERAFDSGDGCMCNAAEFEYIGGDSDPYLDEG